MCLCPCVGMRECVVFGMSVNIRVCVCVCVCISVRMLVSACPSTPACSTVLQTVRLGLRRSCLLPLQGNQAKLRPSQSLKLSLRT